MKPETVPLPGFFHVGFKSVIVRLAKEDPLPLIPASGDMVKGSRVLDALGSCHASTLSFKIVQCQDLTPFHTLLTERLQYAIQGNSFENTAIS